jgi:AraC-like DNA-binding protein
MDELAAMASMSPSSLHQHFNAVTAMSAVQYQMTLQLTEARQFLLAQRADAASATQREGYQSVSRFSWEYARMIDTPAMKHIEAIRTSSIPGTEACPSNLL